MFLIDRYKLGLISFFLLLVVFFLGPVNELLISYYKPNFPFFDFYSVLLALIVLPFCFLGSRNAIVDYKLIGLAALFFLYIFAVVFFSDVVVDSIGGNSFYVGLFFIRKALSYTVLGYFFCLYFKGGRFYYLLFLFLIFIYAFLIDWSILKLNTFEYPNSSQWGNYHYLSECLAILSLFTMSYTGFRNKVLLNFVFLITVAFLFALGSRSTLFFYIFSGFFVLFFLGSIRVSFFVLAFFILWVIVFGSSVLDTFVGDNFRMFSVFIDPNEGSSVTRGVLAQKGLLDIKNNFFTGVLGGQVFHGGDLWGGYIHDFRSYWRQFGLIVFIIYVSLLFFLNLHNFKLVLLKPEGKNIFAFSGLLFFTVESVFARAYLSTYIYFFIGYSICLFSVLSEKYDT